MYCVVSKPTDGETEEFIAKSGGTGISLISLSSYYNSGIFNNKIIEGLGNFLIFLQENSGNIITCYEMISGKKNNSDPCIYYLGEACLGLLYLYENNPQEKWLVSAKKALIYIAQLREKDRNDEYDHWALLAIRKLFQVAGNKQSKEETLLLKNFVIQNVNNIIEDFKNNGSLCSISTVMEGLVGAYYCIDDKILKKQIYDYLKKEIKYLNKFQYKYGKYIGGIPAKANVKEKNLKKRNKVTEYILYDDEWTDKEYNLESKYIRIDFVQHFLSALITFDNIQKNQSKIEY